MLCVFVESLFSAAAVTTGDTGLISVDGKVMGIFDDVAIGVETEGDVSCGLLAGSGVVTVLSLSSGVRSELVVSVSVFVSALQGA